MAERQGVRGGGNRGTLLFFVCFNLNCRAFTLAERLLAGKNGLVLLLCNVISKC